MPRPEQEIIKLTIDGRDVDAVEGTMLVDAAKLADVEVPYFCYEPKLGQPVGACRICIGRDQRASQKLQTSCFPLDQAAQSYNSTRSSEVRLRKNSIVEFLLVWRPPLDCSILPTRAASARFRTSPSVGAAAAA